MNPDLLPTVSRRTVVGSLGSAALLALGGIGAFKQEWIVGHPRAAGDPTSIEQTITDDAVAYHDSTDTVEWPRGAGTTTSEPFEYWAHRKTAVVGSDVVLETIQDRIGTELSGVGKGASGELVGMVISVMIGTHYARDGSVISEPAISKSELIDVAPRTVRVTISLDGREYSRAVPVFVEEADTYNL